MWTRFMDMHSGGGQKEDFAYCYIEAPESEAIGVFYSKFGHNPNRVTCTCCGEDYSISENDTLKGATAFERGLNYYTNPEYDWNTNRDVPQGDYFEPGENIPKGWKNSYKSWQEYITLDDYIKRGNVKVIYAYEINDSERFVSPPQQGYVWRD